ncbi:MAG: redox protein [Solibacillus sp.]
MEAKKMEQPCDQCGEMLEIDFATAQFAVQLMRIQGKSTESRTFYAPCPHCQTMNMVESTKREEWGNRKAPSAKKLFYAIGFGCLLACLCATVIFYFAGRGVVTIFEWLFQ